MELLVLKFVVFRASLGTFHFKNALDSLPGLHDFGTCKVLDVALSALHL